MNIWMKKLILSIILLCLSGTTSFASIGTLYDYQQSMFYCSDIKCPGASDCDNGPSMYPCGVKSRYIPYKYKHTFQSNGFKNLFNPNDNRILCGVDDTCNITKKTFSLSLTTMKTHVAKYISGFPSAFKVYLPPGTLSATFNTYLPNRTKQFLIVRYKMPADAKHFDWTSPSLKYEDVPKDNEGVVRGNLSLMQQRDVLFPNRQGHAFLLSFNRRTPMTADESGWFYVRQRSFGSGGIVDVHFSFTVDVAAYKAWYNTAKWDAKGNPTGEVAPSPEPTPPTPVTPTPVTPTPVTPTTGSTTIINILVIPSENFSNIDTLLKYIEQNKSKLKWMKY